MYIISTNLRKLAKLSALATLAATLAAAPASAASWGTVNIAVTKNGAPYFAPVKLRVANAATGEEVLATTKHSISEKLVPARYTARVVCVAGALPRTRTFDVKVGKTTTFAISCD